MHQTRGHSPLVVLAVAQEGIQQLGIYLRHPIFRGQQKEINSLVLVVLVGRVALPLIITLSLEAVAEVVADLTLTMMEV
tara:strand:- start:178 stop:414 length:237 start_codon:yes stop_codon:yes gene_type:complete